MVLLLLILVLAGLTSAAILSLSHLLNLPIPCGTSHGCATVASHPSSLLLGIPIAYFGVAVYLTLLVLLHRAPSSSKARLAVLVISGVGTAISGYLLYYSKTVIQATCPWCVASGVAMTLIFLLSIGMVRSARHRTLQPASPRLLLVLGLLTATALGAQAGLMKRNASRPPVAASVLAKIPEADLTADSSAIGPKSAPLTIVMFTDFWCPACRFTHASLYDYQKKNPKAVRLVIRHLPLWEIRGHEFSGTAAAMSEMAAEKGRFGDFIHHIYNQPKQLGPDDYLAFMGTLGFDPETVKARLEDPADPAIARVQRDMAFAEKLGIHATPAFIVLLDGQRPVSASPRSLEKLLNSPQVLQALMLAGGRS